MNLEKPKRLIIWNGGSTIYPNIKQNDDIFYTAVLPGLIPN
jgi:hypothetical protein